jgi:hypothetical protein
MTSREHWRTEKRRDVSGYGKAITSKVEAYEQTWLNRCYSDLPDSVPDELMREGLAPSWRAVAMAILLNRYSLLGIYPSGAIFFDKPPSDNAQLELPL